MTSKIRGWLVFLSILVFDTGTGFLFRPTTSCVRGAEKNPHWCQPISPEDHEECDGCTEECDNDVASKPHARYPRRRDVLASGWASFAAASLASRRASSAAPIAIAADEDVPPERKSRLAQYEPLVPFSSIRRSKRVILSNGLQVLLVSEKKAPRASVALSVNGAGQFADPSDLPGLAHLMEHMILSTNSRTMFRQSQDFEDWLADRDGASNGFTAYQTACFHYTCPDSIVPESLERFAGLFVEQQVEKVCRNPETLKREIRRVDSELDLEDTSSQIQYLTKDFVNTEHPYSRFSAGDLESLDKLPGIVGIDVGARLIDFFRAHYLPREAALVVIAPQDIFTLERLVNPFVFALSRFQPKGRARRHYPGSFLQGNRFKQLVLYRKGGDTDTEKLVMEWPLNLDYRGILVGRYAVTATQIAFVMSQILDRRGPGSLYQFLLRRAWIPSGAGGLPRVTIPLDVSGFQILRFELNLTSEGFINRSAVVATVYDSIDSVRVGDSMSASRGLIRQYASIAKLHGYYFAPRPSDAVELAMDAQFYGIDTTNGVGSGKWNRFPSSEDRSALSTLQSEVASTLTMMSDPANALILATAGTKTRVASKSGMFGDPYPSMSSYKLYAEPLTGARFLFEDLLGIPARLEEQLLTRIVDREELLRPVINPLIPSSLRPPRISGSSSETASVNRQVFFDTDEDNTDGTSRPLRVKSALKRESGRWILLDNGSNQARLPLPTGPPEATSRCAFVLEILSTRPARSDVRQAARAELFRVSLESAVADLAELGLPGGLAYDLSFNKFGLRLTFLGPSQALPSYARRLTRRLVDYPSKLLSGTESLSTSVRSTAIMTASRARGLSPQRRRRIISNLRVATAYEVAAEGIGFFRSCSGAVCFGQGDLLRSEVASLAADLQDIFELTVGGNKNRAEAAIPSVDDLVYRPMWKPRYASACSIPGVPLIADLCGRIPR